MIDLSNELIRREVEKYLEKNTELLKDQNNCFGAYYNTEDKSIHFNICKIAKEISEIPQSVIEDQDSPVFDLSTLQEI